MTIDYEPDRVVREIRGRWIKELFQFSGFSAILCALMWYATTPAGSWVPNSWTNVTGVVALSVVGTLLVTTSAATAKVQVTGRHLRLSFWPGRTTVIPLTEISHYERVFGHGPISICYGSKRRSAPVGISDREFEELLKSLNIQTK